MRTDVKLGVVISLVVVVVAGGYYSFGGGDDKTIPVNDGSPRAGASKGSATPAKTRQQPAAQTKRTSDRRPGKSATSNPTNSSQHRRASAKKKPPSPPQRQLSADAQRRRNARKNGTVPNRPLNAANNPPSQTTTTPPNAQDKQGENLTGRRGADRGPHKAKTGDSSDSAKTTSAPRGAVGGPANTSPRAGSNTESASNAAQPAKTATTTGGPSRQANHSGVARGGNTAPTARSNNAAGREKSAVVPGPIETHLVQQGDTMSSLAKMYLGDVKFTDQLARYNPQISDPARLALGARIKIPPTPQAAATATMKKPVKKASSPASNKTSGQRTYTVKSGDTFYGIARDVLKDSTRWNELFELNKKLVKGDPTRLQVGQVIRIPAT